MPVPSEVSTEADRLRELASIMDVHAEGAWKLWDGVREALGTDYPGRVSQPTLIWQGPAPAQLEARIQSQASASSTAAQELEEFAYLCRVHASRLESDATDPGDGLGVPPSRWDTQPFPIAFDSSFAFIDSDRVAALANALDDVAPGAEALGRRVDDVVVEAAELGAPIFAAAFVGVPFLDQVSPGGKLIHGAGEALDIAAEIRRRLEFLAVCERLRADGVAMDSSMMFEDAEMPSREDIEELISMFRESGPDVVLINEDVSRYSATEIDAAISSLSVAELKGMNEMLHQVPSMRGAPGAYPEAVTWWQTSSWLFANVSARQLERLHQYVPILEPDRPDEDGTGWQTVDADLADEIFSYDQVFQGELGDCWLVAALGAVAVSNSQFLRDNIRRNPNGSYTVTLYQHGEPVEVTVSNYVPGEPDGYVELYAAGSWVAIYEKAAAQLYGEGRYGGLVRDSSDRGLELITGGNANLDLRKPDLDELERRLDAGQPVLVGTTGLLSWRGRDDVVSNHVYMVVDITTNADGERVVHVRAPSADGKPLDLWLTEGEYHDSFVVLYDVPVPG